MYRELMDYVECMRWEIKDEDMGYIEKLSYNQLKHLLEINIGRNCFVFPSKRRY